MVLAGGVVNPPCPCGNGKPQRARGKCSACYQAERRRAAGQTPLVDRTGFRQCNIWLPEGLVNALRLRAERQNLTFTGLVRIILAQSAGP